MKVLYLSFFYMSILVLTVVMEPVMADEIHERVEKPVGESISIRQATQKEEEQWRNEREKFIARFEKLKKEQELLRQQKAELLALVESARRRTADKEKQLVDIGRISDQIKPFLFELINELELLMSEDLPFLTEERRQRVERLKSLMPDPDVSISEKYRKVVEALLIEAEYGRTIETYQETITIKGKPMLADIFRLGRISLFFQSLDRKQCGFYNVATKSWETLAPIHNRQIQTAIDIAAKRRPVDLLSLPVGRIIAR